MDEQKQGCDAATICFGFNRQNDEESLEKFINCFAQPSLLATLIPRLADEEIEEVVDFLTRVMGRHFSEAEYHRYFLGRKK